MEETEKANEGFALMEQKAEAGIPCYSGGLGTSRSHKQMLRPSLPPRAFQPHGRSKLSLGNGPLGEPGASCACEHWHTGPFNQVDGTWAGLGGVGVEMTWSQQGPQQEMAEH